MKPTKGSPIKPPKGTPNKPNKGGPNKPNNGGPNKDKKKNIMGLVTLVLWALFFTMLLRSCSSSYSNAGSYEIDYSLFRQWVAQDVVESVNLENGKYSIELKDGAVVELPQEIIDAQAEESPFSAFLPTLPDAEKLPPTYYTAPPPLHDSDLIALMDQHDVEFNTKTIEASSYILSMILTSVLPFILMIGLMFLLFRGMASKGGGMGGMGGVGKANAKVYVETSTGVTFRDVAGQDEAKESLQEIIDILHNPTKYTEIGAKLPKGALLVGPPGTGKTLLAKAVAGEANVPFFSISGSDFVEMFVGVGASRVRDLFKEASKMAPCIIFIDEIDTIGKSRDNRMGGNDEREQTLNQLLAELDGFDPSKGVIVLGATNRPEILDQALLRPGRFDRRITIDKPNLAGRITTLQVHTRKIKLSDDVDLKKIALATSGCVGADLANIVNEAALRAVRLGRQSVIQQDLLASFEYVIAGSEKKNSVLTEFEKKLVAYHEVGHAIVAYKQKNAEPVQKITIVPHTEGSLGYTLLMPEEDKTGLRTKDELLGKITVSMGGRAAEEVVLDTMTNGASQDIQDATNIARSMVSMFGMSEKFGMMALASRRNQYLGEGYSLDCASDTAAQMDIAVMEIMSDCYDQAVELIKENREDMDKVVAYLLEKETITGGEMVAILQGRDPATVEGAYASSHAKDAAIEAPARAIHMISEVPVAPILLEDGDDNTTQETPTESADVMDADIAPVITDEPDPSGETPDDSKL